MEYDYIFLRRETALETKFFQHNIKLSSFCMHSLALAYEENMFWENQQNGYEL